MTALTLRNISRWSGTFLSPTPSIRSAVFAVLGTWLIVFYSAKDSTNSAAIYSGIFDLVSIFTGFLATFYVFVATRSNRFLRRIQHTQTFKMMLDLIRFTIVWSFWMIGFSYVLMVLNIKNIDVPSAQLFVVFFWVFNGALIATNFSRCVYQFVMITELEANQDERK